MRLDQTAKKISSTSLLLVSVGPRESCWAEEGLVLQSHPKQIHLNCQNLHERLYRELVSVSLYCSILATVLKQLGYLVMSVLGCNERCHCLLSPNVCDAALVAAVTAFVAQKSLCFLPPPKIHWFFSPPVAIQHVLAGECLNSLMVVAFLR